MTVRAEFTDKTKREAYALRGGVCAGLVELKMPCSKSLADDCEYDHIMRCEIKPDNSLANCRPLCSTHHKIKTALDAKAAAKGRLIRKETKKSQRPKAKIRSAGFPSKEQRQRARERYEERRS
jgi:5-methylcytosine-specific restriction endonuclease McrA